MLQLQDGLNGTEGQPGLLDGASQLAEGVEGDGTPENPGLEAGAAQLATGVEQFSDGVSQAGTAVSGDGTAENPGLVPTAQGIAQGTEELGQGAQQAADGLAGTPEQPGLAQGAEGVVTYAQGIDIAVNGEGTDQNPGMVADAKRSRWLCVEKIRRALNAFRPRDWPPRPLA